MPLSEHEQRLLEQIEQALYAEDPKFASLYRTTDLRSHYRRRVIRSAILFVLGLGLLLAGVTTAIVAMGVAGFVVMLIALSLLLTSIQRMNGRGGATAEAAQAAASPPDPDEKPRLVALPGRSRRFGLPRRKRSKRTKRAPQVRGPRRSIMSRLEDRWERRQDER